MKFEFTKMHGAGNDFVIIDLRNRSDASAFFDCALVARICNRPDGIGSEGAIFILESEDADFQMRFFNPDGNEADLCGNGARCVAKYALDHGLSKRGGCDGICFRTNSGLVKARQIGNGCMKISMPTVSFPLADRDFAVAGVPHKIVFCDNLDDVDIRIEGSKIRYSREFDSTNGTNVDFVGVTSEHRIFIRTYERGVEDESFACGTGAVAAAVICVKNKRAQFPVSVMTRLGYELIVDGKTGDDGGFEEITLAGPAKYVFSGVMEC